MQQKMSSLQIWRNCRTARRSPFGNLIYSDDVPKVLNRDGSKKLNDTLVYCLEQFRVDPNDPDDRDFHIETRVCNGVRSDGMPAPEQPKTDNDIVKFLNKVM